MENTNTATKDFNFAEDFEAAKTFVTSLGARLPKRAIYWGIGAAVVGVAAVAAVMYRNRVNASKDFSESKEFGRDPDVRKSAEADPDFADTSLGRQTPKSGATFADHDLQTTHH